MSKAPKASIRAKRPWFWESKTENDPLTYQEPSDAVAKSRTDAENGPAPISKAGLITPFASSKTNLLTAVPL